MADWAAIDFTVQSRGADITFKCTDGELYFSRWVLRTVDYFNRMLTSGMTESTDGTITVSHNVAVMSAVLRSVFVPTHPISIDILDKVIDLAEQYGMAKLKEHCENEFIRQYDQTDLIVLRRTADLYQLKKVWDKIASDPQHAERLAKHPAIDIDHSWISVNGLASTVVTARSCSQAVFDKVCACVEAALFIGAIERAWALLIDLMQVAVMRGYHNAPMQRIMLLLSCYKHDCTCQKLGYLIDPAKSTKSYYHVDNKVMHLVFDRDPR